MRLTDRILVCVYVWLALLPAAAMVFGWRDRGLDGSLAPAPRPKLSGGAFRTEQFQQQFTRWFEQSLGFRNYAVVADNTLLYHVFGETKYLARVVIGHDDVLFERDDITLFNKPAPTQEQVDALADRIAKLQVRLRVDGRAFVPVLVPSKTSIYRDAVPAKWKRPHTGDLPSDHIYLDVKRALDVRGVRYVDARALLLSSSVPRQLLWGAQARHWSDYGACLTMEQIVRQYTELTNHSLSFTCPYEIGRARRSHDNYDLMRLLNVWRPAHQRQHGLVSYDPPPQAPKPRILFISSSFGWQLLKSAERSRRFRELWLDYYDSILYGRPNGVEVENLPVDSSQWRDVFLDQDLYIYELFETYLFADDKFVRVLDNLLAHLPEQ